ncbi:MAG TPA: DUF4091 domain-containing protein [Terracidiphilus sp.]|nr:DUF4091 domain-containing protein [Terracidiphilus sp.]
MSGPGPDASSSPHQTPGSRDPLDVSYKPRIDTNPQRYAQNVWLTDTMQKVRRDSGTPGTAHWGIFYGTQNEFVDFQVHYHDPGKGTDNLSITVCNFVQNAPSRFVISSNIQVYREAYVPVGRTVTSTARTYYGSPGSYPDILIPAIDPYFGQTTNAWPIRVAPGENQSAWVDVLIPPLAPPGYYLASVTVKIGQKTLARMPVVIAVWQWPSSGHMPSTATLFSTSASGWNTACVQFYGSYAACGAYPGAHGSQDQAATNSVVDRATLMLDHRLSAANPIYPPYTTTFSGLETNYGPLFDGTAGTMLKGARLTTAAYAPTNPAAFATQWAAEWKKQGWTGTLFDYSCDEPPNGCTWSSINTNAPLLHSAIPPLPALVTTDIDTATKNGVAESIDIMAPVINYLDPQGRASQRPSYAAWLARRTNPPRQLWTYQSCMSAGTCVNGTIGSGETYPNYDIDGVPAANRAMEWMSFRNGVSGELYFDLDYAWKPGNDPWTQPYFFGGWGDGTLVYPGTSPYIGSGVKHPIFLPSIRLKHIRDGMQDYEYLTVLSNSGQGKFVSAQINQWIQNSYTFETTGAGLQAARRALGGAMHKLTYPPKPRAAGRN